MILKQLVYKNIFKETKVKYILIQDRVLISYCISISKSFQIHGHSYFSWIYQIGLNRIHNFVKNLKFPKLNLKGMFIFFT